MSKKELFRLIATLEILAIIPVIIFLWLDEIFDLPHRVFGAPATPINWTESVFETSLSVVLVAITIFLSWLFCHRAKFLEGFLLFCAGCKKVRFKGIWVPVDIYVRDNSAATITHGLCPDCLEQYVSDWDEPDGEAGGGGRAQSQADDSLIACCGQAHGLRVMHREPALAGFGAN